jgi:hypothetical protein
MATQIIFTTMNFFIAIFVFLGLLLVVMGINDTTNDTEAIEEGGWKGLRDHQINLFPRDCDDVKQRLKRKCHNKLEFQKHFYEENGEWPEFHF